MSGGGSRALPTVRRPKRTRWATWAAPRRAGLAAGVALALASGSAAAQVDAPRALADRWLDAERAVLQEHATEDDVDRLMALLAPGAVYEHPRVGARVEGRDAIRAARVAFLGSTRDARMSGVEIQEGAGVVVVSMVLRMDARAAGGWQPVERRQLVVLEHADGRIHRIIDYW